MHKGIEIAPLISKVLIELPKYSPISKYNIWIPRKLMIGKIYAINTLYMSEKSMHVIHIIFHSQYDFSSSVLSINGMYLPSSEG